MTSRRNAPKRLITTILCIQNKSANRLLFIWQYIRRKCIHLVNYFHGFRLLLMSSIRVYQNIEILFRVIALQTLNSLLSNLKPNHPVPSTFSRAPPESLCPPPKQQQTKYYFNYSCHASIFNTSKSHKPTSRHIRTTHQLLK